MCYLVYSISAALLSIKLHFTSAHVYHLHLANIDLVPLSIQIVLEKFKQVLATEGEQFEYHLLELPISQL